mgnify:CR=1 FL=1
MGTIDGTIEPLSHNEGTAHNLICMAYPDGRAPGRDNLIEWGDKLFRRDSMESIQEGTQIYILAATAEGWPTRCMPWRP